MQSLYKLYIGFECVLNRREKLEEKLERVDWKIILIKMVIFI